MPYEATQSVPTPFQIRFGIRQKVILTLVTVLLIAMGVGTLATLREEKARTLAEIDRRGNDISRYVAESLAFSVVGYDYHAIQLLLDKIIQSGDISYARVLSAKGNTMGALLRLYMLLKKTGSIMPMPSTTSSSWVGIMLQQL